MASRIPLEAEAVLDSPAARLTAVAVSVREGHSIAFLGDSKGRLHKVTHHAVNLFLHSFILCRLGITFIFGKFTALESPDMHVFGL